MANHLSDYAKRIRPMPVPRGADVVAVRMTIALPATHAVNDILEFGELPEDCVPVDFVLDAADIDTNAAPAIVLAASLLNAAKTDLSAGADDGGANWLTGATIGQAGGAARPTVRAVWLTNPLPTTRRMVGAKITTGAATAAAGEVGMTFKYRQQHYGR